MGQTDQGVIGIFDAVAIGEPPDGRSDTSVLLMERDGDGGWREAYAMHGFSRFKIVNDTGPERAPAGFGFENDDEYEVRLEEDEQVVIKRR